ncbi:MAG: 30S ribosomal protein S13 [Candidatus Pacebacteria bacterium CG10_big_fil_rev_8_21_14_0_10_36_11]|nr:30S ribosomal protein S13 [Candidatus Pacearchaeota archaeon]OIP73684.1 MAG: 30S ribosomal protein S13 [Candidatus Pacebacteria bacterium CG2_30_36_39]PIR64733.1 MAG: 30S ribosomal protein S13 [Candidatus Pacebacteria bacterium CG10_big_fil_rev_8_21_14_0_10_36_11]PJC42852.1 MAG: 30S ribosomal protein S13 [Candidatus Pacebacteria bacterium CG_4_9_14_0_2_um_filter_36_8]
MPRIAGTDIPEYKKVVYSLRSVFGVGQKIAEDVVAQAKINPETRARDLTSDEVNRIQRILEKYPLEGDLRRMISDNINRLKRIKAYRGLRHSMGLPVRGQRTKVNSRTARGGGRKTVGSISKEAAAKAEAATTK